MDVNASSKLFDKKVLAPNLEIIGNVVAAI